MEMQFDGRHIVLTLAIIVVSMFMGGFIGDSINGRDVYIYDNLMDNADVRKYKTVHTALQSIPTETRPGQVFWVMIDYTPIDKVRTYWVKPVEPDKTAKLPVKAEMDESLWMECEGKE